ncbi:hypothetical protein EMIT0158MI4_60156 [Burkholderia ambifaria]
MHRQRVFEGGVRDTRRSGIVAPAASVGVAGKRGTLRLGRRRGAHTRVLSLLTADIGGPHIRGQIR